MLDIPQTNPHVAADMVDGGFRRRQVSETADAYPAVVTGGKWRIIECPAGIQWILQFRRRSGRYPWDSVSFCRTKEALSRLAPEELRPALTELPSQHPK
jgi:hypothetical protein